jgi:crotonobetainyl-CoA:carnitine CoA-transferase CaiB-like acyl-CoA transferase
LAERAALEGIRVLDLTTLLPGPYCTQLLADLGAEVIKIERPVGGDPARALAPATFAAVNRGKLSVMLDLHRTEDRAHLDALIPTADIFVEGFRPGVVVRLGFGYERLATLNPRLIYCSLSGYGQSGPARDLPGHDLNYLGVVGALDPADEPDAPPRHLAAIPVADLAGGLFAANAVLAALLRRERGESEAGAYLDASLAGAALALMGGRLGEAHRVGDVAASQTLRGGGYRAFVAADGRAFTVGCIEDAFWQRLCAALERPDLARDPAWATFAQRSAGAGRLDALLAGEFVRRPRSDWLALLRASDVPAGPVNALSEVPDDPYVAASGLLVRNENAEPSLFAVRFPVRMTGLAIAPEAEDHRRAPALGEHNALLAALARPASTTATTEED